jgi:hypothetical protein
MDTKKPQTVDSAKGANGCVDASDSAFTLWRSTNGIRWSSNTTSPSASQIEDTKEDVDEETASK